MGIRATFLVFSKNLCCSLLKLFLIFLLTLILGKNFPCISTNLFTFNTTIGFEIGTRDTRHFENLSEETSHVNTKKYTTDHYTSYNLIDLVRILIGKEHTYTVERMSRLLRHYLAHFALKTYCQSKSPYMI